MTFCLTFGFSWGFWLLLCLQIFFFVVDFLGAAPNVAINLLFLVLPFLAWTAGQGAPSDSKLVVWPTLVNQDNLGSPPDQGLNDLIYIYKRLLLKYFVI